MRSKTPITVANGDGIGPEIMQATLAIIQAAGAQLEIETIEIGEAVYKRGNLSGIEPSSWDSLRRTNVFLKAPITTPQGGGFKSMNVTVRKTFGQYANIRPCMSLHPFVRTKHPGMNVVIVRENEEDTYAGIEHRQTEQVFQCLKLISRPGSEKIIRYAFEYARHYKRKKVTCFMKDNIMKMTDGIFHEVFDAIGAQYPEIEKEVWIVDIGAAKLADTPTHFDVIVMPNLYGDILSDVAAQIAGSVGLAGSANIGDHLAMFEAIHGSAPRRAGQNLANPSGLLHGAILMLVHIGQPEIAERVHNAWLKTIEDGVHTYDIFSEGISKQKVGTREFGEAVIARLGQEPSTLKPARYPPADPASKDKKTSSQSAAKRPRAAKVLVGVDLFLDWPEGSADDLAKRVQPLQGGGLVLKAISNRGTKVWPQGSPETFCTDHWCCRFLTQDALTAVGHDKVAALLGRAAAAGLDFIKTEGLYTFNGERGYSAGGE